MLCALEMPRLLGLHLNENFVGGVSFCNRSQKTHWSVASHRSQHGTHTRQKIKVFFFLIHRNPIHNRRACPEILMNFTSFPECFQ